jgi:hypothetical protein
MKENVPLEFSHLFSDDSDGPLVDDEIQSQFSAAQKLAGLGVYSPQFQAEAEERSETFEKRFEVAEEKRQGLWKTPASDPVMPAGDATLAKMFRPEGRRKENLRQFLKSRLAEGDTIESVIAHAERHDARTANLLREIAAELA